ncbi:kinase-like domain-containing protein [Fomitopsis serialis]|uniref:kinase-like domain-containing protein n=1 Tax=Fomitopsis serialis TaxID=139415 RepID=UPI002008D82E|nr:kinase-like domain-containing protein [Neoantrodia serialis]KAH9913539.1 kinase-like domain-containing protein [Neoantrodia serialis]
MQSSDIDDLTNEQLFQLNQTAPRLSQQSNAIGAELIRRLTPGTVSKAAQDKEAVGTPSEVLTLELVFQHTAIPVPRVRRVIQGRSSQFIVMDYIPGRQLSHVWPEMPLWKKLRVVFTLHDYVRQLRTIRRPRSTIPGPVAPLGHPARKCSSPLFDTKYDWRGPFASLDELAAFFNDRYRIALVAQRVGPAQAKARVRADPFDDRGPLVLTHQDINMRNIIVGEDGRLWLIDWAWAGFYPRWFEYVAMRIQSSHEETVVDRKEPLWDLLVPFICGPYYRQDKWFRGMVNGMWYR